jgi:uncharacterized Zn-finger protein
VLNNSLTPDELIDIGLGITPPVIPELSRPTLHPAQQHIIDHPARFKVVDCGRRFGKTILATDWLTEGMVNGQPVAYAAPIYAQVEVAWRVLKDILAPVITYSNETKKRMVISGGGALDMWSLESADSIRGTHYARIVVDEAAYVKGLLKIWEKTLSPLLTDLRGMALFLSTPQGFNDFFKLFQYGLPGGTENWWSQKYPTSANPYIPADEIELQRKTLPPRSFAQEYDASFEEDAGAVYDTFSFDNVTTEAEYNPELAVYWGVDDGYVYGDGPGSANYHPRVILLAQYTDIGGIHIFAEYAQCGELSEVSIANVRAMGYPDPFLVYADSSAAELRGRLSTSAGLQTFGATHKVNEGIKNVRRLICDGQGVRLLKIHPRCTGLIQELQMYRYDMHNNGQEPKPLKLDDHHNDCLRYLCSRLRFNS